jgi:hypothetical protein
MFGSKTSISGPFHEPKRCKYLKGGEDWLYEEFINRLLEKYSKKYIESAFPSLLHNHPKNGIIDEQLVDREAGMRNKLTNSALKEAIGWTLDGQIKGYTIGIKNRAARLSRRMTFC